MKSDLDTSLVANHDSALNSDSVAHYLAHHPDFFREHSELLAQVNLTSPLTGRAVSLAERQMEVMRSKYKALEAQTGRVNALGAGK